LISFFGIQLIFSNKKSHQTKQIISGQSASSAYRQELWGTAVPSVCHILLNTKVTGQIARWKPAHSDSKSGALFSHIFPCLFLINIKHI